MVFRRPLSYILGTSRRYSTSTMASKQPALDFLSFVNAAPTRKAFHPMTWNCR